MELVKMVNYTLGYSICYSCKQSFWGNVAIDNDKFYCSDKCHEQAPKSIKFKKLSENAKLPIKGSEHSGAWDAYATEIIHESKSYVRVKLGFATEIPVGYAVRLSARSNITKTGWIISNSPCLIDADWRGEWEIRFRCIPTDDNDSNFEPFPYEVNSRVVQLWLEKVLDIEWKEVEELDETIRGDGGFGSTGLI